MEGIRLLCSLLTLLIAVFYVPTAIALAQTVRYNQTILGGSVKYFTEQGY